MTPEIRTALAMWENATINAHGGNARKTPLLTAAQLIEAGDKLAELVRAGTDNRQHSGRPEDQEITMNNDDERDYAEEQYNRHLLDDETDPEEEATTCDRCGGRLVAGEGDGRYCGPCANTPDELEWSGWHSGTSRTGHRTAATNLLNQENWVGQHAAIAAVAHAVLALSAPASPEEAGPRYADLLALTQDLSVCHPGDWPGADAEATLATLAVRAQSLLDAAGETASPGSPPS